MFLLFPNLYQFIAAVAQAVRVIKQPEVPRQAAVDAVKTEDARGFQITVRAHRQLRGDGGARFINAGRALDRIGFAAAREALYQQPLKDDASGCKMVAGRFFFKPVAHG